jgi:hypothetical protein
MSTGVDIAAEAWRSLVNFFGDAVNYEQPDGGGIVSVKMFIRGMTGVDDTWGAALQSDQLGVVDASAYAAAFPARPRPLKFDKVRTAGPMAANYTVEEWRAAPAYGGAPVVLKLLLRGGHQ